MPLTINWNGGKRAAVVTYDPFARSYTIEIVGFLAPAAAAIAGRRSETKK